MTTGRQIVKKALQKARVVTKNETPSADEISDGLFDLNSMLASWANDTLLAYVRTLESFPVIAATGSYTIGVGGTFNTSRPNHVVSAYFREDGFDHPLTIMLDSAYDTSIADKDVPGTPTHLLYTPGNPLGTITLYPYPNVSGTLFLRSEKSLAALSIDTDVDFPPGWELALILNLAVLIAPDYGVDIPAETYKNAAKAKNLLKINTARNRPWDTPPLQSGGYFNINTGVFE